MRFFEVDGGLRVRSGGKGSCKMRGGGQRKVRTCGDVAEWSEIDTANVWDIGKF